MLGCGEHSPPAGRSVQVRLALGWGAGYLGPPRLALPPLPQPFDQLQLLECIRRLVAIDQAWVPHSDNASLYIRPTYIGTEPSLGVSRPGHALLFVILSPVGAYFASGPMGAVGLLAEPRYIRAWLGGVGDCKMGGNYAPTILVQDEAVRAGCQQALWLYGDDHQITEVGTMNIFLFWTDPQGELELVTPPLNGIILPGVTRQSLLDLGRKWGEFKVSERSITMADLLRGLREKRVREVFGSGTACVVSPVSHILYQGKVGRRGDGSAGRGHGLGGCLGMWAWGGPWGCGVPWGSGLEGPRWGDWRLSCRQVESCIRRWPGSGGGGQLGSCLPWHRARTDQAESQ
uniref:Branched-chain-amino-acid aminotransferase n=1 Tax=Chelonoidis abingdonii TaxID=106734 RepID=A0A8C0IK48_CHEAB